ncbi:hypothetical protein CAPTEDRAFT_139854 [Capitella teleta]|uniref:Fucosyltransferase n=1 Tax=Capitella teleta TaxID=283909 RepID=R7UC27_CAPTE|nr:hypothetical protein CAPTEDRAFT_139854 [Capitella teleta]|eukprot:ELU01348.1 hypothetical protein CAPTEDRAFT_139854 [Capitella teleta]
MPSYRFQGHRWLFYEFEAPPQTWIQYKPIELIRSVFNLTSTITLDSHIPIIEGHRTCYFDDERYKQQKKDGVNYAAGKKRSKVAWFVSHCRTQSRREDYAKELAKYIPVDIWGKCGNRSCGNTKDDCDKKILNKDYKFYLSFENSICEGYVTEKLWRLSQHPISAIPIVLGSVNYTNIIPGGVFLNIKDFPSPKHLADRLKAIDQVDEEFNDYIRRKNSLICHPHDNDFDNGLIYQCKLCNYLHTHRNIVTKVDDIVEFYSENARCTKPEEYYKGSFDIKS